MLKKNHDSPLGRAAPPRLHAVTESRDHGGRRQHAAASRLAITGPVSLVPAPPRPRRPAHAVPAHAGPALRPALQRRPGSAEPRGLSGVRPRGLLPGSDRTQQGDGDPRPRGPLAGRRPGAGVLHRGPEGTLRVP